MNDKIIVSADCICDLPESLIEEYSIQIIPFYIEMKGVRFQDYTEVDFASVYEYLEKDDAKLSSSSASVADYKEHFQKITTYGNKVVIHICVSSKLSKAYANAIEASKDMENVYVVDSGLISHGMGLLVLNAAKLVRENCGVQTILTKLQESKTRISCSFVLKSTQYVANNNRLNPMISNLLDIFRIKPVIRMKNGVMKVSGICLGNSESYVKKYIRKTLHNKSNISDEILFIAVLSCSEGFKEFVYKQAIQKTNWKHVYVQDVSATSFCNVGLGSVGVMFYTK